MVAETPKLLVSSEAKPNDVTKVLDTAPGDEVMIPGLPADPARSGEENEIPILVASYAQDS